MKLNDCFSGAPAITIDSLAMDSRKASNNSIFFCIDGLTSDGHDYVNQAIENGAVCIVHSKEIEKKDTVFYYKTGNVLDALNNCCKVFYNNPTKDMTVYGVTGTNGKTTIASIIRSVSSKFNTAGYIGTLGVQYDDVDTYFGLTTPDPIVLNEFLYDMNSRGIKDVAIEVSSHGLELQRVDSVDFDVTIFTNISRDHLDFHKTLEEYINAKKKLFSNFNAKALLNMDDEYYNEFASVSKSHATYGFREGATYQITNLELGFSESKFDIVFDDKNYSVKTKLVCEYNVYNVVASIAAMHMAGRDLNEVIDVIKDVEPVSGRMNKIADESGYNIYVDYAHTPDAFIQTFEFINKINTNNSKVIVVFGSAGKRDKGKRAILGEIADKYTDYIVLTEEDSRDEKTENIALEIKKGIKNTPTSIFDYRYDAIKHSIAIAEEGDIILILGKGQEHFLDRGDEKCHWMGDDEAVIKALEEFDK